MRHEYPTCVHHACCTILTNEQASCTQHACMDAAHSLYHAMQHTCRAAHAACVQCGIQSTCSIHAAPYMQRACNMCAMHLHHTFNIHAPHTCNTHAGNICVARQQTAHISCSFHASYMQHTCNIHVTRMQCTCSIHTTHMQHSCITDATCNMHAPWMRCTRR